MTNEQPNPTELHGDNKGGVIRYTCSDGVAIAKGALLFLDDPKTVSGLNYTTNHKAFAGIASSEKEAADGQITIGVWTKGIFDLTCGAVNFPTLAGELVVASGGNLIVSATEQDILSGCIVGKTLETGSSSGEIQVLVGGL